MRRLGLASMALLAAACGRLDYRPELPAGDAGHLDGGSLDGSGLDGGGDLDGGGLDGGLDGGALDAGDRDAGATDSGGSDAGLDGGSDAGPMECPFEALFCDGYEDPALGAWSYSVQNGGTAERTVARSRSGAASLLCIAEGTTAKEARYSTTAPGAARTGDLWLRAFYFLPSTVTLSGGVSILSLSEREPPYQGMHVLLDADSADLVDTIANTRTPGALALPRDRWVCVEVHLQLDESAGALDVHLDGVLSASASGIDTVPTRGVEVAEIGIHYATAEQPRVELSVDDVVISPVRVGCD